MKHSLLINSLLLSFGSSREFTGGGFEYFSSFAHMATLQKLEMTFVKHIRVELEAELKFGRKNRDNEEMEIFHEAINFLNEIDSLHNYNATDANDSLYQNKLQLLSEGVDAAAIAAIPRPRIVSYDSKANELLANPINQYKLIERMTQEWPNIVEQASNFSPHMKELYDNLVTANGGLPSKKDLDGSADAIMRLQDTYLLSTKDIAAGDVLGAQASVKLDVADCYHIGRTAYFKQDYYHTVLWMREAYRQIIENNLELDETQKSYEFTVLDHLSYSLSQLGFKKLSYRMNAQANAVIDRNPSLHDEDTIDRLRQNKVYYFSLLSEEQRDALNDSTKTTTTPLQDLLSAKIVQEKPSYYRYNEFDTYEDLCRQKTIYDKLDQKDIDKLTCKYETHGGNPRLILKPAKIEFIRRNPDFVFIHGIVTDEETEIIKEIAKPHLSRATVQNPRTGKLEFAEYRVSKHAWLGPRHHEVVYNLNQRIMDITGLDTRGVASEELQVGDYFLGFVSSFYRWRDFRISN